MEFLQRVLVFGLFPVIALLAWQQLSPNIIPSIVKPYTATGSPHDALVFRAETPLIVSAFPHWSHFEKIAKIAVVLAELGYPITFITGRIFEKETLSLHPKIKFYPLLGKDDKMTAEDYAAFAALPPGSVEAELFIQKAALIGTMDDTHLTLQEVYQNFRDRYGNEKPILSLYDSIMLGHSPILLGAPGIRPDLSFSIAPHPITLDSNDTYPFHIAKEPETGPNAKEIHWQAYQARHEDYVVRELNLAYWAKLRELGADRSTYPYLMHAMTALSDHVFFLGVPEFEWPRTDLRANLHYFGALKQAVKAPTKKEDLPSWWADVAQAKKDGKKIVAVSQGTVEFNLNDLLIPTLEALKDRNDVLVIASTVVVEPEDVPGLVVPANARAAKFVPYEVLLPLVDVLINNGGYGAVQTALNLGIPMVVSGVGQDKVVTNNLVHWTEVGVNLKSRAPSIKSLKEGIGKILDDNKYKRNAVAMSKHYESYDMGEIFDSVIKGAVDTWKNKDKVY